MTILCCRKSGYPILLYATLIDKLFSGFACNLITLNLEGCALTQVLWIRIRIQLDPELFSQIRILALINDPVSTLNYFSACKSHKIKNLRCLTFTPMNILFRAFFSKKKFQKKLGENLFRPGSRFRRFQNSDPDLVKNRPDLQQSICFRSSTCSTRTGTGTSPLRSSSI
jgi:hypothetical protein